MIFCLYNPHKNSEKWDFYYPYFARKEMESQKTEFAQGQTARNRQGGSLSCSES